MISTTRSPARRPFLATGPSVHPRSRLNARYFALKSPGDSSKTALAVLLGVGVLSPLGLRDGVAGFAYFDRSGNPAPVPAPVASNGPSNRRITGPPCDSAVCPHRAVHASATPVTRRRSACGPSAPQSSAQSRPRYRPRARPHSSVPQPPAASLPGGLGAFGSSTCSACQAILASMASMRLSVR